MHWCSVNVNVELQRDDRGVIDTMGLNWAIGMVQCIVYYIYRENWGDRGVIGISLLWVWIW